MGAKEEGKFQRDLNSELGKTATAYEKIKEAQQDILFFTRDYAQEAKKFVKELGRGSIEGSETAKAFRDVASAAKDITDNYSEVLTGEKTFQELIKQRQKLNAAQSSFNTEFEQELLKLRFTQEEINSVVRDGGNAFDVLDAKGQDISGAQMELLQIFMEQNQQLVDEADNMEAIADAAENIDDAMRPLGKSAISLQDIGEGLEKGLGKAGLGGIASQLGLGDAVKDARMYAAELTKGGTEALGLGGKFKVAGKMASSMGSALTKSLGPIAIITKSIEFLVGAFKALDGGSGKLAKNFGVSAAEGRKMALESKEAAEASGDLMVNMENTMAAQMSLNKTMGTAVKFPAEMATEFASIQARTGLSEKAMGKFASKALIAGTSIKDQLVKVQGVVNELNAQNSIQLNIKDIQEGIAEISNANALAAKNNTKEMANQVFQSKMLGISQQKVNDIAGSLLDFETSIQNEMEAELLLGKNLNLEKARTAALNNDMATVAIELGKQGITAEKFGKMNRITAEATAAAMGMSRDEMGDMLMNQEKLAAVQDRYGKDIKSTSDVQALYAKHLKEGTLTEELKAKFAEDGVIAQHDSITAQDKLNAVMQKMQDLFVGIVEPLMPLIDTIMKLLDPVFKILSPIFKLIGAITDLLVTYLQPKIDGIINMFSGLEQIITSAINLDFGGMLDGLKAVGKGFIQYLLAPLDGLINLLNKIPGVDIPSASGTITDLIGLAEGGIVTKPTVAMVGEGGEPEAVIPLSKFDEVTGGNNGTTNIVDNRSNTDMTETNKLLKSLISAVSSGGDVYLDGNKVGKSLAIATSNMG